MVQLPPSLAHPVNPACSAALTRACLRAAAAECESATPKMMTNKPRLDVAAPGVKPG